MTRLFYPNTHIVRAAAGAVQGQGVLEAIGKLKEKGLSILLVEQNASLAVRLVDYVQVLSQGRVVYSASPKELWANDEVKSSFPGA